VHVQLAACKGEKIHLVFSFSIGFIPRLGAFWKVTVCKLCLSGSSEQQGQWAHQAGSILAGPQPGEGAGPGMTARVGDSLTTAG